MLRLSSCLLALLLASSTFAAPAPWVRHISREEEDAPLRRANNANTTTTRATSTATDSAPASSATVPLISLDPNDPVWDSNFPGPFEAIRGKLGASIIGPNNPNLAVQNPDLFAPPSTDAGSVYVVSLSLASYPPQLADGQW